MKCKCLCCVRALLQVVVGVKLKLEEVERSCLVEGKVPKEKESQHATKIARSPLLNDNEQNSTSPIPSNNSL